MKNTFLVQFEITTINDELLLNREVDSAFNILYSKLKTWLKADNDELCHAIQSKIKNGLVTKIRIAN
jgi:hypothetical protein